MSYSFSPDHANPNYDPNYNTPEPKSKAAKARAAKAREVAFERRKRPKRPVLSLIREKASDSIL